jgi:hypothetical protein
MKYEEEFDGIESFSRLEITAISSGMIVPVSPVFYKPLNPMGQYDHGKRLTKEAEETTQEAIKEAEKIHQKYRKD